MSNQPNFKIMKKVVVITGTSSGIGFTLAEFLTQKKYVVYGLSRSIPSNANFTTISVDITQKDQVKNAIEQIISKENKIDVLINNAGKGMVGAIEDAKEEENNDESTSISNRSTLKRDDGLKFDRFSFFFENFSFRRMDCSRYRCIYSSCRKI